MNDIPTKMYLEVREIPDAIQRLIDSADGTLDTIASDIRDFDPDLVTTIARGSSDHAATYLKYAIELIGRKPVASIGPSINSIYDVTLDLKKSVAITISQSGQSPDILSMTESAQAGGAMSIGITNNTASRLARIADHTAYMAAGPELSVAATKTFVNSVVTGLLILAKWTEDKMLLHAIHALPKLASQAIHCDWGGLLDQLLERTALFVLGRGPSLAIAYEAALKFKETCQIQGQAFSAAEVLHGPASIVSSGYPVVALIARDASRDSFCSVADELSKRGASIFGTSLLLNHAQKLPFIETGHVMTDPLMLIVSFYANIERLARMRGLNPDTPPNLRKVTETI